jgi:hypothetical protein
LVKFKHIATKYEHVSTGAGFKVRNGAVETTVIAQDGSISGAKLSAATVPTTALAANAVTSAKLDTELLQAVTVNLTAANLIAMYATPVVIIPAVAGKAIYIQSVEFDITRTATAFTGGGVVNLQYKNTANGAGTTLHADIAATVVTGAAGTTHTVRIPSVLSDVADADITNVGVYISNKTAAFAAGTGTASVTVRYYIS